MNITNSNAFWLLFLVLIPILIHLFQFRRYKTLKFSNLFFLSEVNEEQKRSRRLKHILILISRISLIIFLIFSIAKPFWKSKAMNSELNLVVLDHSASNLGYADGSSNPIIEENMGFVNQLFERYPQSLKAVNQLGNTIEPYQELKVHESVTQLSTKRIADRNLSSGKFLFLSDFQKSIIDQNISFFRDTSKAFVFMPPYSEVPLNVWVDSLWIEQNTGEAGNEQLQVRLGANAEAGDVSIALENNKQLIGTQQVFLDKNELKTLRFPIKKFSTDQDPSFKVSIEAGDLEFDNTFNFILPERSKIKVLLLSDSKSNPLLTAIYENEELFDFKREALNNFAFQDLDEYDLVITKLGARLNDFAAEALKIYAASGKNLVVIPTEDFDQHKFINDLGFSDAIDIFQNDSEAVSLQSPDFKNPFFSSVFEDKQAGLSMPEAKLFLKWKSGQNLLSFINGYPFLGLSGVNENVFAFSTPFTEEFTNFPQHGIFLPVFYKMAFIGRKENKVQYFYLNQEVIELPVSGIPKGTIVKLRQQGQVLVPDQQISGNRMRLILPQEDINSGFYDMIDSKTDERIGQLALNIPKEESVTDYYTVAELSTFFQDQANVLVLEDYGFSSIKNYIDETKNGFPLWKYFLVLALLSLLAEVLIIRLLK